MPLLSHKKCVLIQLVMQWAMKSKSGGAATCELPQYCIAAANGAEVWPGLAE